ncbi:MAG: hypothetical protein WD990_09070 [Acidimicrobiia bacterium]
MAYMAEVSLEAAIVAVTDDTPRVLTVDQEGGPALPSGSLGDRDPTLELALRRWITDQTGIEVGYVEQLYTFGDLARHRLDSDGGRRRIGVAYLALIREAPPQPGATWVDWYRLLPWEDHRHGRPAVLEEIAARLGAWTGRDEERRERAQISFGLDGTPWDPVRVLDRYELLYGAGLVRERALDHPDERSGGELGRHMAWDHRRVAATALGRLRGKLTYRPVVFELLAREFTLAQLQGVVEALLGTTLHTQNFRRLVSQQGLVDDTGRTASTGGRPARLYRFRRGVLLERAGPGLWRR